MGHLLNPLNAYAILTLLIALRLTWQLLFQVDEYVWKFGGKQIIAEFVLIVTLWPLLIFIRGPRQIWSESYSGYAPVAATKWREHDRLRNHPPPCGPTLLFRQEGFNQDVFGEFIFETDDVKEILRSWLMENSRWSDDDEGALLRWITNNRTSTVDEPSQISSTLGRFAYHAYRLIRSGKGSARCGACKQEYDAESIVISNDMPGPAWNSTSLFCPERHELLVIATIHVTPPRN